MGFTNDHKYSSIGMALRVALDSGRETRAEVKKGNLPTFARSQ